MCAYQFGWPLFCRSLNGGSNKIRELGHHWKPAWNTTISVFNHFAANMYTFPVTSALKDMDAMRLPCVVRALTCAFLRLNELLMNSTAALKRKKIIKNRSLHFLHQPHLAPAVVLAAFCFSDGSNEPLLSPSSSARTGQVYR